MARKMTGTTKKATTRKSSTKGPAGKVFASESGALETWLRTEIVPSIEHVYALIEAANRNYKQGNVRVAEYNKAEITHTMMAMHQKFQFWVEADSARALIAA